MKALSERLTQRGNKITKWMKKLQGDWEKRYEKWMLNYKIPHLNKYGLVPYPILQKMWHFTCWRLSEGVVSTRRGSWRYTPTYGPRAIFPHLELGRSRLFLTSYINFKLVHQTLSKSHLFVDTFFLRHKNGHKIVIKLRNLNWWTLETLSIWTMIVTH